MATKIPKGIDTQILIALSQGVSNKDVAELFKVSTSYVSKLKNGKKTPSLKITEPSLIKDEFFEVDNNELTELLVLLNSKDLILDRNSIIEYLEIQMKKCLIHAKMYQLLLDKYKGEN